MRIGGWLVVIAWDVDVVHVERSDRGGAQLAIDNQAGYGDGYGYGYGYGYGLAGYGVALFKFCGGWLI